MKTQYLLAAGFVIVAGSAQAEPIDVTSSTSVVMQPAADPNGPLFSERVVPGYERGMYGYFGMGAFALHTPVTCPYVKDGCTGNEVSNLTTGNHSTFVGGFGFRFNPYVALEASVSLMNGGNSHAPNGPVPLESDTSLEPSWDVQPLRVRLDFPVMTGLSVYGTAGVGIKIISAAVGELDAQAPSEGCAKSDPLTGRCLEAIPGGRFQAVSDPPNRVYLPVSAGLEWWIFQSPDWALNINYQPPQGAGPKFYQLSVRLVGAF